MITREMPQKLVMELASSFFRFFWIVKRGKRVVVLIHEEQTWEEARETCDELGLRLLTINSEKKNTKVAELLQEVNEA